MIKVTNESTSTETSSSISIIIAGMHTTLSELDALIEESANEESKLTKKDVNDKVRQLNSSLSSIKELLNSYHPNAGLSSSVLEKRIWKLYTVSPPSVVDRADDFLLSHGADENNPNMFDGVSEQSLRTLYSLIKKWLKEVD